jgi:hypothetical protein
MESSNTLVSSSASKSVRFESSSVESASEETSGVSKVFKLTHTTSADGRPVFTKTIEGSNLERKWVVLYHQWDVSDLQWTVPCDRYCLSVVAFVQILWEAASAYRPIVYVRYYCS